MIKKLSENKKPQNQHVNPDLLFQKRKKWHPHNTRPEKYIKSPEKHP